LGKASEKLKTPRRSGVGDIKMRADPVGEEYLNAAGDFKETTVLRGKGKLHRGSYHKASGVSPGGGKPFVSAAEE